MYQNFSWTKVGEQRNEILKKYEPVQPYIFLEFAREMESGVFIDVGANIGAYSIFLSSLECVRKVYSFEAASVTFHELQKNVQLNDKQGKIQISNLAISDQEGTVCFGIVGDFSGANSILSTSIHRANKFTKETTAKCVPLDSVVTERSQCISVKIDVEGHERAVLVGAKHLLTENGVFIQVEDYAAKDASVSDLLEEYGYSRLLSIGPDVYFTNRNRILSAEAIISAFERATAKMIQANFEVSADRTSPPIRVHCGRGAAFEISGPLAAFARRLRERPAKQISRSH